MSSCLVRLGGGLPDDTSGWVRGVTSVVDRGMDLSVMASLSCAFFLCYQVSRGAIVAYLNLLKENVFIIIFKGFILCIYSFLIAIDV